MRAPSMSMAIFAFAVWVPAAFAFDYLLTQRERHPFFKKIAMWTCGILSGLGVLFLLLRNATFSIWKNIFSWPNTPDKLAAMQNNAQSFSQGTLIYLLIVISIGVVFYYVFNKKRSLAPAIILLAVIILDLWIADKPFIQTRNRAEYERRDDIIDFIKKDDSAFRVLDISGRYAQNVFPIHGIADAMGFHDFELKWYRAFRGGRQSANFFNPQNGFAFMNLANVKYLIAPDPRIQGNEQMRIFYRFDQFEEVYQSSQTGLVVFKNHDALNKYRLYYQADVRETKGVDDFDAVIDYMNLASLDFKETMVIENFAGQIADSETDSLDNGKIDVIRDDMRGKKLVVTLPRPGFLFISENYFPYWHVYQQNQNLPVFRAFGTFQAVFLTTGVHELEFRYESQPLRKASWATAIGLALFVLGWIGNAFTTRKSN